MASTPAGQKRKAAETEPDNDSDYVVVASPHARAHKSGAGMFDETEQRGPLLEVNHNKRRRVLQCVLIPPPMRESATVFHVVAGKGQAVSHAVPPKQFPSGGLSTISPHNETALASAVNSRPSSGATHLQPSSKQGGKASIGSLLCTAHQQAKKSQAPPANGALKQPNIGFFFGAAGEALDWTEQGAKAQDNIQREKKHGSSILSADTKASTASRPARPAGRPRRDTRHVSYAQNVPAEESSADDLASSEKLPKRGSKTRRQRETEDLDFDQNETPSSAEEPEDAEQIKFEDESEAGADNSLSELRRAAVGPQSERRKKSKVLAQPSKSKGNGRQQSKEMRSMLGRKTTEPKGLDRSLPPLSDIGDIFMHLTAKGLQLGLRDALEHLGGMPLRVATMCSGTESPLLALQMVGDKLEELGERPLRVKHVFSAEIVPYKQAYIERNFAPPIIFRDITEFPLAFESAHPQATTAYGALVSIPKNIDILVAGTSCVDYSRQNKKKKAMSDGGESGQTWFGALAYCKACRPAIVIFENVVSAEWDNMLRYYRDIDYECAGMLVDTKDYYIPQTRQRGYMVCFDMHKLTADSSDLSEQCQAIMASFRRLASSPVSDFVLPSDQITVRHLAKDDENTREQDWSQCEMRHVQYRHDKRLGGGRPTLHWQESGAMLIPDLGDRAWFNKQPERVRDFIEISRLRKALKCNYDSSYKTRVWNVTQNVDRDEDTVQFGIVPCLLPRAYYFLSDASRPLTAEENLKLQGMPLSSMSFTTETASELLDLAGNAMTTTVVGSALLASLIAGYGVLNPGQGSDGQSMANVKLPREMQASQAEADRITWSTTEVTLDVTEMLDIANRAARRCYCEGTHGLCSKPLQQCVDCGHTTCMGCGGNPSHRYRQVMALSAGRVSASVFTEKLSSQLPLQLTLNNVPGVEDLVFATGLKSENILRYCSSVAAVTVLTFSLQSLRRTHCWTISYATLGARLDLVIDAMGAEWRLYVLPAVGLTSGDWLRQALQQPVGRATVTQSLLDARWEWRMPVEQTLSVQVQADGADVPSWWARSGLPDYKLHTQPQLLQVTAVAAHPSHVERLLSGTYRVLPKCGKAFDSLYRRTEDACGRPVFLFQDPGRTQEADNDGFVFSNNIAHLEYDQVRPIIARIQAPWTPWPAEHGPHKPATVLTDDMWLQIATQTVLRPLARPLEFLVSSITTPDAYTASCSGALHVMSCTMSKASYDEALHGAVDVSGDRGFLSRHLWVFEAMRRQTVVSGWQQIADGEISTTCDDCAPDRPHMRWTLDADRKSLKAYEDPESAARYERAVKARPAVIVVTVNDRDEPTVLNLGVNIASLLHRATARLPGKSEDVKAVWRLDTADAPSHAAFPRFRLKPADRAKTFDVTLNSVTLSAKQRSALAWMRSQETGTSFRVEEAEEASLAEVGWRAEVRASATITVRGGICADHPGFGKTIMSLALIEAQHLEHTVEDIHTTLKDRLPTELSGLRCSLATLIVCPGTLMQQWVNEIKDQLGYNSGVLTVSKTADLSRYTHENFANAKIIVLNRSVLANEFYAERLAAFAAVPGPAAKSGRAYSLWLDYATKKIPEHLAKLHHSGSSVLKQHIQSEYKSLIQDKKFQAVVPSRRLHGKDYVEKKDNKAQVQKAAPSVVDTKHLACPLFEMFYFNRLIVDEFHLYEARELAAVMALKADKRWGLDGTPDLSDSYDVAQLANLLNVPLAIGGDVVGVIRSRNIKALRSEMTAFERFDAMRQIPSRSKHDRIHEIDQRFLDAFVRRNVEDFADFRSTIVPAVLDFDHQVLNTELNQHLNSLDMRMKRGKKAQGTDREERLYRATMTSETAEEALSRTVAFIDRNDETAADAGSTLKAAIGIRENEVADLLVNLSACITAAEGQESSVLSSWKASRIENETLGEIETIASVKAIFDDRSRSPSKVRAPARKSKAKRTASSDSEDVDDADDRGTKPSVRTAASSEVNRLSKRLVVAHRSLRYMRNALRVQRTAQSANSTLLLCEATQCVDRLAQADDVAVSALCGHIICKVCYEHLVELHNMQCPVPECTSSLQSHNLLWKAKMGNPSRTRITPYGAKLEAAMNIIGDIRSKGDQAILFVQFSEQIYEAQQALADKQIPAIIPKDNVLTPAQVDAFRDSKTYAVIVLNASDETSSGLNLQNANHVIFLSPLLRDTLEAYEATMAQAIGRVRRHKQQKQVHVYRIAALNTIDVDILEQRERRTDAMTEDGAPAVTMPVTAKTSNPHVELQKERVQLVKENGRYSLRPRSWLVRCESDEDPMEREKVKGKSRVMGWEDFSSLVKFSRTYTENDD